MEPLQGTKIGSSVSTSVQNMVIICPGITMFPNLNQRARLWELPLKNYGLEWQK